MKLPNVVQELIKAQNNFDSVAYANLFSETSVVYDEGKTHTGRKEIQKWIAEANEKYKSVMEAVDYKETGTKGILSAKVSGTFEGSPAVLKFNFEMNEGLIKSLKITG
ncbi:nuclear transport factor 2 family protein [Chryseosolibacter indicus]|uniref:Nuclear transport factor 2 family protein n=1 Tax=Chryseosolibacter indicus TaxID=2782351 RepID=A0ABS5VUC5_9BACT|nr:nuclear transport factor 2 family protein [Chryseosolibacter indicus]MBT1704435.1 nuclear transport factor 2 family protein [Chryseosolibacter indicus]